MKVKVIKTTKGLIPNQEHQNFTEGQVTIPEGTVLEGEYKDIEGLRRGQRFVYRLFVSKDNTLLYAKNTQTMEYTEVKLGADASRSATRINLLPAEYASRDRIIGVVVGGIAGYAWSRKKGAAGKTMAMYIGAGAAVGYTIAAMLEKNDITVKSSK